MATWTCTRNIHFLKRQRLLYKKNNIFLRVSLIVYAPVFQTLWQQTGNFIVISIFFSYISVRTDIRALYSFSQFQLSIFKMHYLLKHFPFLRWNLQK